MSDTPPTPQTTGNTGMTFKEAWATMEGFFDPGNVPARAGNPFDLVKGDLGLGVIWAGTDKKVPITVYPHDGGNFTAGWNAAQAQLDAMASGHSQYKLSMTLAQIGPTLFGGMAGATRVAQLMGISVNSTLAEVLAANGGSSAYRGGDSPPLSVNDIDPALALPVHGMEIPQGQVDVVMARVSPQFVIRDGLDQTPWNATPNLVPPARRAQEADFPVTFQIYFGKAGDSHNRLGFTDWGPTVLTLKASIQSHQRRVAHVVTKQKTQTGLLVNLWGTQPDQISGQASTGVMMNQLGLSDFLSMSTVPRDIQDKIRQAVSGKAARAALAPDSMRIAAKDAFVEFLAMFKNNGVVWFRNQNYTGDTTGMEQTGPDAWSPITGSSIFQNAARRNDVLVRGGVIMAFRNTSYTGYFKNLSWVMDAKNPFRWNFNFTFQVERAFTAVLAPQR